MYNSILDVADAYQASKRKIQDYANLVPNTPLPTKEDFELVYNVGCFIESGTSIHVSAKVENLYHLSVLEEINDELGYRCTFYAEFKNLDLRNTKLQFEKYSTFKNCCFETCSGAMRCYLWQTFMFERVYDLNELALSSDWAEVRELLKHLDSPTNLVFDKVLRRAFQVNLPVPDQNYFFPYPPPFNHIDLDQSDHGVVEEIEETVEEMLRVRKIRSFDGGNCLGETT